MPIPKLKAESTISFQLSEYLFFPITILIQLSSILSVCALNCLQYFEHTPFRHLDGQPYLTICCRPASIISYKLNAFPDMSTSKWEVSLEQNSVELRHFYRALYQLELTEQMHWLKHSYKETQHNGTAVVFWTGGYWPGSSCFNICRLMPDFF